jgi:PadR family transcriptional regulator AphA
MDVKTLCLGALTRGDATGYEIKKHFEDAFSHFYAAAGYGSIYPALAELAEEGLVTCTELEQEKRPDKKVYSLTEAGRRAFVEALMRTPGRHKIRSEFLVLMYFAHLLPPQRLAQVMDERAAEFDGLLAQIEACGGDLENAEIPVGVRFTMGYGLAVLRAGRDYIRANQGRLLAEVSTRQAEARAG